MFSMRNTKQHKAVGRLNSSFGVRRSSILKSVCVESRRGFRHHEDYLCRSSENTHRHVMVLYVVFTSSCDYGLYMDGRSLIPHTRS